MSLFCGKCGTPYTDEVQFCTECGKARASSLNPSDVAAGEVLTPGLVPTPDEAAAIVAAESGGVEEQGEVRVNLTEIALAQEEEDAKQPPAKEAGSEKPPLTQGRKVAFAALSVLVSIFMFVSITAIQLTAIVMHSTKPEVLAATVRAAIMSVNFSELEIGGIINDIAVTIPDFERDELSENSLLSQIIYNSIHEYYIETYGIRERDLRQLLSSELLGEFVADIVENGLVFVIRGEGEESAIISSSDILRLLRENAELIENATGFPFDPDSEYAQLLLGSLVNTKIDNITWGSVDESSGGMIGRVQSGFSLFNRFSLMSLITLSVLSAGMLVALFFLNIRRKTNIMLYGGIPAAISGACVVTVSLLTNLFVRLILEGLSSTTAGEIPAIAASVETALTGIASPMLLAGLLVLGVGVTAIVAKILVFVMLNKTKQVAVEA
ncbi:MAG: zinc ribbon domain-containing protein [Oscillospiraceae bacterium]|nr:zinc ribbon domain-containing protein [Oscillospiraceae bacterium]